MLGRISLSIVLVLAALAPATAAVVDELSGAVLSQSARSEVRVDNLGLVQHNGIGYSMLFVIPKAEVPEPGSIALVGLGLLGAFYLKRKRRS